MYKLLLYNDSRGLFKSEEIFYDVYFMIYTSYEMTLPRIELGLPG